MSPPKETMQPLPLEGVRVLDLTRVVAGPYCAMLLGDMGAEVLKVEEPTKGDDTRAWGPPFVGGESAYFFSVNRNKKSITLDLKAPKGKEILKALAARCDILLENFKPGTMEKLGLGYDALEAVNPGLIYCAVSGFGRTGPYRDRAGYDVIAQAMGGLMGITGEEGGKPVKVGVAMTDLATALHAHGAVLAALWGRQRTGRGCRLDLSLLETQVISLINIASSYLNAGEIPRRWGTAHPSIVPYQALQTKDGYLIAGCGNEKLWQAFCQVLESPDLAADPRFQSNADRVKHREVLIPLLEERLAKRTTAEWDRLVGDAGIPCGPIYPMDQVFTDPQVVHLGLVQEVPHPAAGTAKVVRHPASMNGEPFPVRLPPPLLGQHTEEILRGMLGMSGEDVAALRRDGVV